MPILIILLLAAACLPVAWPEPVVPLEPSEVVGFAGAFVVGSVLLSALLGASVVRRAPHDRPFAVGLYLRQRQRLFYWNLLGTAALVLGGWGWAVKQLASDEAGTLLPYAELLVPAPYLLILFASWSVHFFAERALHRTGSRPGEFWSLSGYVGHQARMFALTIGLPVMLLATQQSLARHLPELVNSTLYQIASFFGVFALFFALPLIVKPMLGLRSVPAGPIRDRLTATGERLRFRCTDWLLWPTRGLVANAMIVGVVPQARYVIFTDRLLDALDPPELDAVVGHEIGHARHGHMPYYFAFFCLSSLAGGTLFAYLERLPGWPTEFADFGLLVCVSALGAYIFTVFGFLSRACERQADIVGVKAASCGDPNCEGHTPETVLAVGGEAICPTGVRAMVRALDVVMHLSGLDRPDRGSLKQVLYAWWKSWQHGPPSHRIDFLLTLLDRPERAARHDRYAFRLRVTLAALLCGALAGAASLLGWDEFLKQL